MPSFRGSRVLVTGVGRAGQVGDAIARAFADADAAVLLVGHDLATVQARADEMRSTGRDAAAYSCDLADAHAVEELARRVTSDHAGGLAALVNVAGGFEVTGSVAASDPARFARQIEINLTTAYLSTRAFLPAVRQARGAIVYFASEAALAGGAVGGLAAYAAAKSAVVALMRSVASDEASHGVRANAVAPGAIRTAANVQVMGEGARYVEIRDVSAAVLYLSSEGARAITGQVIRLS